MAPPRGMIPGREIMQKAVQAGLSTEILYSFALIVISLMIYFGTKEFYNLTSHKGTKYFRMSFLFFAIAFFSRSFLKFLLVFLNAPAVFEINFLGIEILSLLIFMYASSMAIFYLLFSVMWKKWDNGKVIFFHILAVLIAIITFVVQESSIIFLMHLVLFIFIAIITFISYKNSREKTKGKHLHGIYLLLFAFWILNILDLVISNTFQAFQLLIYVSSLSIFLSILYKVLRKIG